MFDWRSSLRDAQLRIGRLVIWDMSSSREISEVQPRIVDVYETVLYGSSIDSLAAFYRDIIGLPLLEADPDLMAALRLPNGGVMLVFDPAKSAVPGRHVPSHGAEGPGHVAFRSPTGRICAAPPRPLPPCFTGIAIHASSTSRFRFWLR
jgi:hypothetical protein